MACMLASDDSFLQSMRLHILFFSLFDRLGCSYTDTGETKRIRCTVDFSVPNECQNLRIKSSVCGPTKDELTVKGPMLYFACNG